MEIVTARLLARPILQEYDASTVDELDVNLAESGKLGARHNLVEIAEACWKVADACTIHQPSVRILPTNSRVSLPANVGS